MSKSINVPKLRFKEFSGEWQHISLKDIASIVGGGTPDTTQEDYWNGEIQWFTPTEIKSKYIKGSNRTITELGLKKSSAKVLPQGTLLLSSRATVGDVGIAVEECTTNQGFQSLIVNDNNSNEFFYNWIIMNKNEFIKRASGSTFLEISKKEIEKIKAYKPSKQEQEKIASFLTSVDTKIEQLTKKEELLQQYKKGVMQKIFNQEIRFKADDGSEFCDWEEKKLGEITYNVSQKNKENLPYPVYSINNKKGFIPQGEQFEGMDSNNRNYDISLYKIIDENTFAYNPARINVGSLGYSGNLKDIIISSLYVCFKTNKDINDKFLLQYFSTFEFNKSVLRNTEGGVRDYLFYENFSNIKTKIPCIEEQTKIANFLSAIDYKIEQVQKQLNSIKEFKKALLQQMFI